MMTPEMRLNLQRCAVRRAHIAAMDRNRGRYWRELATCERFHVDPDRQWLADCDYLGGKL
jgi:hypothetical protein